MNAWINICVVWYILLSSIQDLSHTSLFPYDIVHEQVLSFPTSKVFKGSSCCAFSSGLIQVRLDLHIPLPTLCKLLAFLVYLIFLLTPSTSKHTAPSFPPQEVKRIMSPSPLSCNDFTRIPSDTALPMFCCIPCQSFLLQTRGPLVLATFFSISGLMQCILLFSRVDCYGNLQKLAYQIGFACISI